MKNILNFFLLVFCFSPCLVFGAITVKKAAPVATKKADTIESATSLVPAVTGILQNITNITTQQQQLSADCAPTTSEINMVNDLVKEWAKIGDTDSTSAASGLGNKCDVTYEGYMVLHTDKNDKCYEFFKGSDAEEMVWKDFPKASVAKRCKDTNEKNCETVSNIYDVFGKISFSEQDYTKKEAENIAKLIEKSAKCAPSKINAAKREMWGNLLTNTISGVGTTTKTAGISSVLEAVSSMGGSSDIKSSIAPALGNILPSMLEK